MMFKLKGATRRETYENYSFAMFVAAALLVMVGIGLGSFVPYAVFLAAFGAFLILPGIILYIYSQLLGDETSSVSG